MRIIRCGLSPEQLATNSGSVNAESLTTPRLFRKIPMTRLHGALRYYGQRSVGAWRQHDEYRVHRNSERRPVKDKRSVDDDRCQQRVGQPVLVP